MINGFYTQFITMGITVVAICTTLWSCAPGGGKQPAGEKQSTFTHPEVPVVLQSPQERATYLVVHFWDNFNFADTTLVGNAKVTEQAFVNYINFFPHVTAIRSDKIYNLRAIPTLYLLDKNKNILLKDAPIEAILDWLNNTN